MISVTWVWNDTCLRRGHVTPDLPPARLHLHPPRRVRSPRRRRRDAVRRHRRNQGDIRRGRTADPESPGTAWSWAEDKPAVRGRVTRDADPGDLDERNDHALPPSIRSRVPLLIATPRTDGTGLRAAEATGSCPGRPTEHGSGRCTRCVHLCRPMDRGIVILASGVPYLMLDANPVLVVEEESVQAVLPPPGRTGRATRHPTHRNERGWPVRFPAARRGCSQRHGAPWRSTSTTA